MDGALGWHADVAGEPLDQKLPDLARAPVGFFALDPHDQRLDLAWQLVGIAPRPPRPVTERFDIRLGAVVDTGKDWSERRRLVLEKNRIYTNLDEVIQGAKTNTISLAILKPAEIIDMVAEDVEQDWSADKKQIAAANLAQGSLFAETDTPDFKLMPKLPVKFSYRFRDD